MGEHEIEEGKTSRDWLDRDANRVTLYWEQFLCSNPLVASRLADYNPRLDALGIKAATLTTLLKYVAFLFEQGDQLHIGPVNGRSIATIRKAVPFGQELFQYVKLLQLRPESDDPVGLEHADVLIAADADLSELCAQLRQLEITCQLESNDSHVWLSVMTPHGFEFKLVTHSVWAVCGKEMAAALTEV